MQPRQAKPQRARAVDFREATSQGLLRRLRRLVQFHLGHGVSLSCGFGKPFTGLRNLANLGPISVTEHGAVDPLRDRKALVGSLLAPLPGFNFILLGALPIHIHLRKVQLGLGFTGLRPLLS